MKCNDDACRDGVHDCELCDGAKEHRKTCPKCKDRKNWTLLQPAHGSLITLPHEWNQTHEHAVLDNKEPRGLRISINTKHITQEDINYFQRLEREAQAANEAAKASPVRHGEPKVYDCHKGKSASEGCSVRRSRSAQPPDWRSPPGCISLGESSETRRRSV